MTKHVQHRFVFCSALCVAGLLWLNGVAAQVQALAVPLAASPALGLSRVAALRAGAMPWHLGGASLAETAKAALCVADMPSGTAEVVVAVLDSGVLASHPALAKVMLEGYNFVSAPSESHAGRSSDVSPDARDAKCLTQRGLASAAQRTHGTEMAGLIAGNGFGGMWGVSPNAKILPIRLFGACPAARHDMLDAIEWAAGLPVAGMPANPTPAKVINMSFSGGGAECGADLQASIDKALQQGALLVAAAGNTFSQTLKEPANCKGVISVGSIDAQNHVADYSAVDPRTTVYAPGGGKRIQTASSWAHNKLRVATFDIDFLGRETPVTKDAGVGTSYSAALVSGWLALWLSHAPHKTMLDFQLELPQYLQAVEPVQACAACQPRGMAGTRAAGTMVSQQ